MARRARSGTPFLRPLWRTALWSLTEFPALVESAFPPAPAVPSPLSTKLPAELVIRTGPKPSQPEIVLPQPTPTPPNLACNATVSPTAASIRADGRVSNSRVPASLGLHSRVSHAEL